MNIEEFWKELDILGEEHVRKKRHLYGGKKLEAVESWLEHRTRQTSSEREERMIAISSSAKRAAWVAAIAAMIAAMIAAIAATIGIIMSSDLSF